MGCFKIDKIDKIVIAFTLIIVTMTCIFNTFSFASTIITPMVEENRSIGSNYVIQEKDNSSIYYYELKKGHTYKITNNRQYDYFFIFSDSLEVGTRGSLAFNLESLPYQTSKEFIPDNDILLTFFPDQYASSITGFIIEDITKPGLPTAISDLVGIFGFGFFDNVLVNLIPYISVVVLFSLGVWFIKHNIIEHSKGREY